MSASGTASRSPTPITAGATRGLIWMSSGNGPNAGSAIEYVGARSEYGVPSSYVPGCSMVLMLIWPSAGTPLLARSWSWSP